LLCLRILLHVVRAGGPIQREKMEAAPDYSVIDVDRLQGDLIIYFNDGQFALFGASLLRSMLARATPIDNLGDPDEDAPRHPLFWFRKQP